MNYRRILLLLLNLVSAISNVDFYSQKRSRKQIIFHLEILVHLREKVSLFPSAPFTPRLPSSSKFSSSLFLVNLPFGEFN